ncbi:hypothetical protein [Plantibacter flavus]|uniref:hypothetical protein n=1 Tax=Plantibacter flavus TaxID=150123 RepID=UPI003F5CBF0D
MKDALADGVVSDREYAEMTARYEECLSSAGITLTSYEFDGSAYLPPVSMENDEANRIASDCSERSGEYPLSYFYVQMRANPDHEDLGQAIVDCLKREGLVGSGYGLKDYRAGDLPTGDADAAVVATCTIDPRGLLGG